MLTAAVAGFYRAEYFGLLGWVVTGVSLWLLFKQHSRCKLSFKFTFWDWVLAVGLIVAAGLYLGFPTESILGGRDQGVYANHGIHIANHGRLDVPYPWPENVSNIFALYFGEFPGFYKTQPTMTAQFAHLFPVWLAQVFSTFGYHGLFRLNGIFALLSLSIFYGLCRFALPKSYAASATLFLALNPSEIWLARITLTEILTQLFILSGLWLLLLALENNSKLLARWAGIFLGFSALVRIDSFFKCRCCSSRI
jgi:4-amino-4-deoxy-L-arabinose transferase-like glycosyltransferase